MIETTTTLGKALRTLRAGTPEGDELRFRCLYPGHPDVHPSSRYSYPKGVFYCDVCKKGGSRNELVKLLQDAHPGLTIGPPSKNGRSAEHLDQAPPAENSSKKKPLGEIVAEYDYNTPSGALLFQVCRTEDKEFPARHWVEEEGWVWERPVVVIPYRLPQLLSAPHNKPRFAVEGEKDVDRLASIGLVASTVPGGVGGLGHWAEPNVREHFRGLDVVLIPDNDPPGVDFATAAGKALHGVARSIRWLDLPDLPPKGDVSDYLDAGHTKEDLLELVQQALVFDVPTEQRFVLHNDEEDLGDSTPEPVVKGVFNKGEVGLVVGEGGSKKTFAMMVMAVAVAKKKDWVTFKTTQGPVLYIDEENGQSPFYGRLQAVKKGLGVKPGEGGLVHYTNIAGLNLRDEDDVKHLRVLVAELKPVLVVFDALVDIALGGDENSVKDMHPVFHVLRSIAEEYKCAIVVIHHTNKKDEYRGSTAIKGACDIMLMVKSDNESPLMEFTTEKARNIAPLSFAANAIFEGSLEKLEKFRLVPTQAPPIVNTRRLPPSQQEALDYVTLHGDSAVGDIAASALGCTPEGLRRAVYKLATMGLLEKRCATEDSKRAVYGLPAPIVQKVPGIPEVGNYVGF